MPACYFLAKTQARITLKLRAEDARIPIKSVIDTSKRKPVLDNPGPDKV
jgi:hypothetical protein